MKHWKRGDPIEAERLNQQIRALELEASRGVPIAASTMVGDALGMQSVNARYLPQQMFIAAEDFNLPTSPTDEYAKYDNIPSGRCYRVRLNRFSDNATFGQEISGNLDAERVYDPIAEIQGVSSITKGDIFYGFFNPDSGRLEANLTDLSAIHVRLLTDLHAAENYMTDPSYATAMVYRRNGLNLKATSLTVTVTNRITTQSFDAGWEGYCIFFDREWVPVNGECSTPSSSSGSVEESIEDCLRPGACDPVIPDFGSRLDLLEG